MDGAAAAVTRQLATDIPSAERPSVLSPGAYLLDLLDFLQDVFRDLVAGG